MLHIAYILFFVSIAILSIGTFSYHIDVHDEQMNQ